MENLSIVLLKEQRLISLQNEGIQVCHQFEDGDDWKCLKLDSDDEPENSNNVFDVHFYLGQLFIYPVASGVVTDVNTSLPFNLIEVESEEDFDSYLF